MNIKDKIQEHIVDCSDSVIQKRAQKIVLEYIGKGIDGYLFSYKGTRTRPYTITVDCSKKYISTECSCPYSFGGLCKHEVAALEYVRNRLISDEDISCQLPDEVVSQFHQGRLQLIEHTISEKVIHELQKIYPPFFALPEIHFKNITQASIEVGVRYGRFYPPVIFQYDEDSQILMFTSPEQCDEYFEFVLICLLKIVCFLGESFFDPEFKQKKIQQYLKDNEIDEVYAEYFEVDFINDIPRVVSKLPNFHLSSDGLRDVLLLSDDDVNALEVLVDDKQEQVENMGFGICIERNSYNSSGWGFVLFHGKYKKNTTELATSFKRLSVDNLSNYFSRSAEVEQTTLLDIFASINDIENLESYPSNDQEPSLLGRAYVKVAQFIEKYKRTYPFFIKADESSSFVRKNLEALEISDTSAKLCFSVKKAKDVVTIVSKIHMDTEHILGSRDFIITPYFCVKNYQSMYLFESPKDYLYLKRFKFQPEINFPVAEEEEALFLNVIQPLRKYFTVEHDYITVRPLPLQTTLHKEVYISDFKESHIVFRLGVRYRDTTVMTSSHEDVFDKKFQQWIQRDRLFENEFVEFFQNLHPDFLNQKGVFYLKPYQLIENDWLIKASQRMNGYGIELFGVKELKLFQYSLSKPSVKISVDAGIDWFELALDVSFDHERVPLREIKRAVVNKERFVRLQDGKMGLLPEKWLKKLSKYFKAGAVKDKSIRISQYQFNILDELYEELEEKPAFLEEMQAKKVQLMKLSEKDVEDISVPKGLNAQLRPYQQEGFNWLVFLHKNGFGGCLADDMGLGKTLQVITLLFYLKKSAYIQKGKPVLIVAPTSLVFNWYKELEKFAPELKVLIYTGTARHDVCDEIQSTDIVISTYGIVVNDCELLQNYTFSYIIADESQSMKNPTSQRYKAMRLLKAEHRLALTGTPIENNTFDLYAQMNFINPGMLGSMNHFKTMFSDPIDRSKDSEVAKLLHEIVYPFLLRRTKVQVADDLPPKTEQVLFCEMGREQRAVYDSFKKEFSDSLMHLMKGVDEDKAQLYILQALTKLRQICNAPQLLDDEDGSYTQESIKLDILLEHVAEIVGQGSKILIFSQFTSMLSLVKERLESEGISFEYLDGKTRNRQEHVRNFQENDDINVFLISLKAGGTGLNLTKAEYVFLLDPWWNPAVENQAIDRCYRIGQTRHVIAYRMICKDTIEEKIMALQADKQVVSDSIIHVDTVTKSFNKAQIEALLS